MVTPIVDALLNGSDLPEALRPILLPVLRQIAGLLDHFTQQPITPPATFQFETQLQQFVHELARRILQWQFNHSEAEQPPQPKCSFRGTTYKRAPKKTMRKIHTLFGTIKLWRYRYTASWGSAIFPLEMRLGCIAGPATSALAVLMNLTGSPATLRRSFLPRPRTSPRSLLAFSGAGSQAPTTLSPSFARTIFAMPTPMGPRPT